MFWYVFGSPAQEHSTDQIVTFIGIWSSVHIVYAILYLWSLNWLIVSFSLVPVYPGGTVLTVFALSLFSLTEAALLIGLKSRVAAWFSIAFHGIAFAIVSLILTLWLTIIVRDGSQATVRDMVSCTCSIATVVLVGYLFNRSFAVAKACSLFRRRIGAPEVDVVA